MKAKYLLTAMAAAPLMFSCTQDDLLVQENGSNNEAALQERVKVGKVAFIGEKETPETRFNYVTGKWVDGDMFRLFLMDEWKGYSCGWGRQENGEEQNANKTHFMEQHIWNKMYSLNNRISTNIPFYYNSASGAWENDDAIVEGNYFAVVPATGGDQKALLNEVKNRRDVWVYINPVQKFDVKKNAAMTDGMDENQFFLGYTQVYRNEQMVSDENVLQLPLQLRPVLANIDMVITNHDELPFKVEKLVIKRNDGGVMPTLAYVRPCGNKPEDFYMRQDDGEKYFTQQWAKVANDENIAKFESRYPELCQGHNLVNPEWQENGSYESFGPAFAQPYIVDSYQDACGKTIDDYYWTVSSWTRTAARSVVTYSYPGDQGFIPYGCAGDYAKPAYEYVIDFTDENGEGVVLNTNEWINPYFTLPHNMYMKEYSFILYGQQYNPSRDRWEEGVIIPSSSDYDNSVVGGTENDGTFQLPDLDPSQETDYIEANIRFDDFKVTNMRKVQVTNSDDLMNHLESYFGKNGNFDITKNEIFYVTTLGDFEVSQELVDYVQKLYDAYGVTAGSKALIYFVESKGVNDSGKVIFPEDLTNNHAIDLFYFSKKTKIVNRGTQVIEKPIIYDYNKSKAELLQAYLASTSKPYNIFNDGIDLFDKFEPFYADLLYGGVRQIINEGTLTIDETLVDADKIYNAENAVLNIENSLIVGGWQIAGKNICVHNDGEMNITQSHINGTLKNDKLVNIFDVVYVSEKVLNYNECVGCPTGAAELFVNDGAEFYCDNVINGTEKDNIDRGIITIKDGGYGYFSGTNYDVINVYGELTPFDERYDLVNDIEGRIKVKNGELKFTADSKHIINDGFIYVIGKSHVAVNDGTGIIDITEASVEGGYQASSNTTDTYFRYKKGAVTIETLKAVISSKNFGQNGVILEFTENATQKDLSGAAVRKVLVKSGVTLKMEGTEWWLENATDITLGASYNALEVENGATLEVLNGKTLSSKTSITAVVDGKFRAENNSKVQVAKEEVAVDITGTGVVEVATSTFEWTQNEAFAGKWTKVN